MNGRRSAIAAFLVAPVATAIALWLQPPAAAIAPGAGSGRSIYIAEGCVHCHSQYVRPVVDEGIGLGPARPPDFPRHQTPVLIGNRRQGPDLMNVGLRRTREWHRLHLIDPRQVSPGSLMPSYAHLFATENAPRGEALLDYLESLGREPQPAMADAPAHLPLRAALRPTVVPDNLPEKRSE